jgi:hypothetical protein
MDDCTQAATGVGISLWDFGELQTLEHKMLLTSGRTGCWVLYNRQRKHELKERVSDSVLTRPKQRSQCIRDSVCWRAVHM